MTFRKPYQFSIQFNFMDFHRADRTFPSTSKSIPHTATLANLECRGRRISFLALNSDEESMSISSESGPNDDEDDVLFSEFVSNSKASSESSEENSTQEIDSEEEVKCNNNDEEPSPGRRSLRRVAKGVHGQRRRGRGRPRKLNSDGQQTKQSFTTFLCQQCGKSHSTELRLYKHLLLHEKQSRKKGNPCCFCYLSFVSEQADKLHMKRYHRSILTKAKPLSCEEKACKESFATLPELNDHLKAHSTNEDILYCSVCRWGFINEDLLKLHEIIHTPKRSGGGFQCPSCPSFSFKNVIFLQNHYNHKHGSNLGGFKCPECDLSLATESSLKKHLKRHEDPEIDGNITEKANCVAPPPCSVCGLQFLHLKYLDKHRKDVHNLGVECPTCHKLVSCRTSLLRHNQNVHQPPGKDTRHPCPYCGVTWRTRHYLYEHIAVHHPNERGVEGKHECPGCHEKFARNVTLWKHLSECDFYPEKEKTKIKIQHKRATNPTRPYQSVSCHICGKPVQKMKLQIHLNTHLGAEEKEEHPCDKCKRVFGSEHLLRKHLKLTHKYVGEDEDIQHVCEVCGMVLANNPSLKRHVEAHAGEKKFACHLCQAKFTAKTTLKSHLNNLHGKPKGKEFTPGDGELPNNFKYPHNCMSLNCGERFATEVELKVHVERSHFVENEQVFMCKLCGKVFANQTRLTRHYLIHTKEKPHKCHVCSKAFAHKSTLKEHLEAIHDEGKDKLFFRCDQPNCDAIFKCRNYIFKHLRKVHGVYSAKPKNK
ncbi:unnamed protein product [Orchesella dallaii]|uniref:C2H2-type domain-containing protein n=1 Tax=Orchesella dallaii TaxID=48710 RepID=A0ABP1RHN9_9HEXA